jgi:hypothetical protein
MTTTPEPTPERIAQLARTVHTQLHSWGKTPLFFAVLTAQTSDDYQFCFIYSEEYPRRREFADIATEFLDSMPGTRARTFGFGCVLDDKDLLLGTLGVVMIADSHGNLWRTMSIKRFPTADPIEHYHPAATPTPGGKLTDEIRAAGRVVSQFRDNQTRSDDTNPARRGPDGTRR